MLTIFLSLILPLAIDSAAADAIALRQLSAIFDASFRHYFRCYAATPPRYYFDTPP
jgi:hypothetical protein